MLHELYIRWTMPTVALLASLVSACATLPGETPYPREIAGHILTVRENGKPQSIASLMRRENIPGGVNCEDADTQPSVLHAVEEPDDIDDDLSCVDLDPVAAIAAGLREHLQARPADTHVLLFVHGGLNNRRDSFQRAVELLRKSDGPSDSYYPIFVNWRSALLSSYWDHLSLVRQGEENRSAKFWSPLFLATDLARAIVGAPQSWVVQGKHAYDSKRKKELFEQPVARPGTQPVVNVADAGYDYGCESSRWNAKAQGAWWLATSAAKLVTTPAVVEIGRASWDIMLRRTQTLFWTTDSLQPGDGGDHDRGALKALLDELEQLQHATPFKITLVGHSMGAIVANRMLAEAPSLVYQRIVHMASADSVQNTFDLTFNYLRSQAGESTAFYSLMLHGHNENREVSAWGLAPSGSLLAWIDNMFTTPPTSRSRTAGRWSNMRRFVSQIPESVKSRTYFTLYARDAQGHPLQHGEFDDCRFWTDAFWNGAPPEPGDN